MNIVFVPVLVFCSRSWTVAAQMPAEGRFCPFQLMLNLGRPREGGTWGARRESFFTPWRSWETLGAARGPPKASKGIGFGVGVAFWSVRVIVWVSKSISEAPRQ